MRVSAASSRQFKTEFPAKAGTHWSAPGTVETWVPAFAGNSVIGSRGR
jgi:hypothetical protein